MPNSTVAQHIPANREWLGRDVVGKPDHALGLAGAFNEADVNKDGKLDDDEYLKGVSLYQRANAAQYASDGAVTTKVKAALLKGEGIPSTAISVEADKGKVQLSGFVESKAQVVQAGTIAKGVSGVTSVQNNLQVKWSTAAVSTRDGPMRQQCCSRLSWRIGRQARHPLQSALTGLPAW